MEVHNPLLLLLFSCFLFCDHSSLRSQAHLLPIVDDHGGGASEIRTYIVHVARPEGAGLLGDEDLKSWHLSFLPNTTLDSGRPRMLYSYRNAVSGFAARLTAEEVAAMKEIDGFVYAQPDKQRQLLTTYTPSFLGLSQWDGAWTKTLLGEGIIIGVLDTGILPTHPSFNDDQMPPAPTKWNRTCGYPRFRCNNKIIGASAFYQGTNPSPIDENGHGTHVASTAAGSFVDKARVLGMAKGTASGMAPKAHLAIYKVCFQAGCADADILAGIDQAIGDGVDVISMSIGGAPPTDKYYKDRIALGSLAAIEHGISAVAAAGNYGPAEKTFAQDAPWVVTVGATSTDRRIGSFVQLGNGEKLEGESAYQPSAFDSSAFLPIVYPGKNGDKSRTFCMNGSLDYIDVRGKVVLCHMGEIADVDKGKAVDAAGGAAMILMNLAPQGNTTFSAPHVLPVSQLSSTDGRKVRSYFFSTPNATAAIVFNGTGFGYRPSPALASFSSRGPALMNGGILKPDVLAPGVNILAAWPFAVGPNPSPFATNTFNFVSGTSMATPHVSGIIALIKSVKPQWSPAAIQSAIVTSATDRDLNGNIICDEASNDTASIFSMGAGQVNASGALDPGLVYDINPSDYIAYLCGLGYTDAQVTAVARRPIRCATAGAISASQLNYPSITGSLARSPTQTFERTATNVGDDNSVYLARITEPVGVRVDLSIYQLQFSRVGQERNFTVQLSLKSPGSRRPVISSRGKLEWVSGKHVVASPIAVRFV